MAQASFNKVNTPLAPQVIRLLREVALYFLGAIALYLLIALWTYHANDPSWSQSGMTQPILNRGGRVGAWLADVF